MFVRQSTGEAQKHCIFVAPQAREIFIAAVMQRKLQD